MKTNVFCQWWYVLMLLPLLVSCNSQDEENDPHGVDDPQAQVYRMFIDHGQGELQQKKFKGQLRIASWEQRFGATDQIPMSNQGNYVSGWTYDQGKLWRYMRGPNKKSVHIVTLDLTDGTMSSATDLDGDNIADLVDISLSNNRRFSFATEPLGLAFFENWLIRNNPFCNEIEGLGLDYPIFGCDDSNTDNGGGLGTGAPSASVPDLLRTLCEDYYQSPRRGMPNIATHGDMQHKVTREDVYDDDGQLVRRVTTDSRFNESGQHEGTTRIIYNYDDEGNVESFVIENVDKRGNGTRTTIKIFSEGDSIGSSQEDETFTTDPDTYIEDYKYNEPPVGTPAGDTSDPGPVDGPFGPDTDLAAWCEAQVPYESGAEQAADRDPAAFRLSCDDLVGGGTGSDCTIIEWASPADFNGVLEVPSSSTGCGPFEEPGPDGTCGTSSAIQRLKGMTAEILSGNFGDVVICNPLVCRDGVEGL